MLVQGWVTVVSSFGHRRDVFALKFGYSAVLEGALLK